MPIHQKLGRESKQDILIYAVDLVAGEKNIDFVYKETVLLLSTLEIKDQEHRDWPGSRLSEV